MLKTFFFAVEIASAPPAHHALTSFYLKEQLPLENGEGLSSLQREVELDRKVASVLGAAYGLKVLAEAGGATGSHVENTISMTLRATTLSDISSYLAYQINRLKDNKKEKPTDYKAMLELLNDLINMLNLEKLEKNAWKDLVLSAFLNFKRVCKAKVDAKCASNCAREVIEMLRNFKKEDVDVLDQKVVAALRCIVECKPPEQHRGGRYGRHY